MSRQMFQSGGPVYMEEGGAPTAPSQEDAEMAQILEMIRQNDGRLPAPFQPDPRTIEGSPSYDPDLDYVETFLMSNPPIRVRKYKDGRVERERMPRMTG